MMPWRLWGTATAITGGLLLVLANTTPSEALSANPAATPIPTPPSAATPTPPPTTIPSSPPTPIPTPTSTPTPTPTGTSPAALIYVANADSGPVTAYAPGSSGAVAPVRTVSNPQNPNTVWDP